MAQQHDSNRRFGQWRKFEGMSGIEVDRRSGLERRSGLDRRQPDLPTLWLRPERRTRRDRREGSERRVRHERRGGEERRLP
jgi:hypothetical protein